MMVQMPTDKDSAPRERPPGGEEGRRPPGLVKCPHCGRLVPADARRGVPRERTPDLASVFKCPACGLEIKERHLA
jgi:uncharacterized C2H2 Zn-finger protein